MKRSQRNTRLLENIAEISHMLMASNEFSQQFTRGNDDPDSVEVRFAAIDAALAFDAVETRTLSRPPFDGFGINYDWMDATERYVQLVSAQGGDGKYSELARQAIVAR